MSSFHSLHPLLMPPEEGVHELSDEGAVRVEEDPELAPGHDCCAKCAGPCEPRLLCASCRSVQYCCPQHLTDDAPGHATVCAMLHCMRQADEAQARMQEPQAGAPADAAPGQGSSPHEGGAAASEPPSSDAAWPPPGNEDGWEYVVPQRFLAVYPRGTEGSEDERAAVTEEPPRKRARKTNSDAADGAAAQRGSTAPMEPATASGAALTEEARLDLAVELAERTAVLSYPYTAALALRRALPAYQAAAAAAAAQAAAPARPLELVVLGAAADAELADLPSWQVVAATLGRDVRILFVGPEVPDQLAGSGAQHGRVAMRFQQSTYDELLAGAGAAGPARGSGAAPAPHGPSRVPDAYLAFNPGFTCPDYEWNETLLALGRAVSSKAARPSSPSSSTPPPSPKPCLVVATNTLMEAQMEEEALEDLGWRAAAPVARNPYTSLQLAQSGTLANDLYRKNAWLVVYRHQRERERERGKGKGKRQEERRKKRGGGRGGGRGGKGAAKRMARALYDAVMAPISKLVRRR